MLDELVLRRRAPAVAFMLVIAAGSGACSAKGRSIDDTSPGESSTSADDTPVTTSSSTAAVDDTATSTSTTGSITDDATGPVAACGNGVVEPGEQCDADDLADATCLALLGYGGEISCTEACTFELVDCVPPGMILVPGGPFEMGSDMFSDDERPARQVQVDDFYIDATEVTVAEYAECVQIGECSFPGMGGDCNWGVPGREGHPLNCVSWTDASAYCARTGSVVFKRLPTEAEWEKAARSDDARVYPWGDDPLPSCTHISMNEGAGGGCGASSTIPAGSKPLGDSPYGVHDMAGSMWNWVSDWYAVYDVAETDNPTGPLDGMIRVMRGGGWDTTDINWFRSSARIGQRETNVNRNVGFRCAQPVPSVE